MKLKIDSKYTKWGATAFITASACIVFFFMLHRAEGLMNAISLMRSILTPFIYGFVMAYLLTPVYNFFVRLSMRIFTSLIVSQKRLLRLSKVLATIASLVLSIAIISGLMVMVIPQTTKSILKIVDTFPNNADVLMDWLIANFHLSQNTVDFINENVVDGLSTWIMENVVPSMSEVVEGVSVGVLSALTVMKNLLIGLIISVYFLNGKDTYAAQGKKFFYANCSRERAELLIRELRFINRTFSGFINGKIIDSAIIGLICFVVMSLMGMPYNVLISVIVGVTNVIPFFGPFIGAIPSTIIILLESPIQALYFVIFILILQQLDGNVIGPKILGDSTGIPSFWVIFAILIGSGLFGFIGMVVGIPIFAVLYHYTGRWIRHRLTRRQMPTETSYYRDISNYTDKRLLGSRRRNEGKRNAENRKDGQEKTEERTEG